jgi:hypothetical protein
VSTSIRGAWNWRKVWHDTLHQHQETDNLVDHIVQLTDGGTDCIMFLFGNSERSRKCIRMARYRSLMYASIRAFSPGRDADRTRSAS